MEILFYIILGYLALINVATFIVFYIDQYNYYEYKERVPEKVMLYMCAAFGALGGWLAMVILDHKKNHKNFYLGVPGMFMAQVVLSIIILSFVL